MPNPIEHWTEDDALALPGGENDSFERKGSRSLDLPPVKQGVATMEELGFEKAAGIAVDKHPEKNLIRQTYPEKL